MPASDHADFWVIVGTVAPVTIAADVILIGQSIPLGRYLKRQEGETTWTSRLREHHLHFIGIDLALCLAVIGLSMNALWTGVDSVAEAWTATILLLIALVTLCILAVCTSIIDRNKHKNCNKHKKLFELNRDGVSGRLPGVFSWRLRWVMGVLCRECRQCGHACADWLGYGIRMPGGLRVWRAGSGFRRWRSSAPSSAPDLDDRSVWPRVRVVHPFHPWSGREFEFVQRRRTWDVDRVFFRVPGSGTTSRLTSKARIRTNRNPKVVVGPGASAVTRERSVSSPRSSNPCMRTSRPEATAPRLIPFAPSLSIDHAFETRDTSTWATLCAQSEPLLERRSVERAGRKQRPSAPL